MKDINVIHQQVAYHVILVVNVKYVLHYNAICVCVMNMGKVAISLSI